MKNLRREQGNTNYYRVIPFCLIFIIFLSLSTAKAETFIYFDSQTGDYIGGGIQQTFTTNDGVFSASRNYDNGVNITFHGDDYWHLEFVAPFEAELTPGVYENATRFPFQSPTKPGLSISGAGRGCNTLTGRFEVLEVVYDPSGNVQSFAADFEQHCEGGPAALFGVVRYNSQNVPAGFDQDLDGVIDVADNCPSTANSGQEDIDLDGIGDVCDPFPESADNLGTCLDQYDNIVQDYSSLLEENAALLEALADEDQDGVLNSHDRCPATPHETPVDLSGCSLNDFCAQWTKFLECFRADWMNDEPLRPKDCRWLFGKCQAK